MRRTPVRAVLLVSMLAACSSSGGDDQAGATSTTAGVSSTTEATSTVTKNGDGWETEGITAASSLSADGHVVVVVDVTDGELEAVALDARSGKELWRQPTTPSGQFGGSGVGGPVVVGDTIVLLEAGARNDFVVGRAANDGDERWREPVQESFTPVRCGALVCTAEAGLDGQERVVARDPTTGEERWSSAGDTDAVLSDEKDRVDLLLGDGPALRAVDPATGRTRWTRELELEFTFPANTAGGWAFDRLGTDLIGYVGAYEDDDGTTTRGAVIAVELATGASHWVRSDVQKCSLPVKVTLLLCPEVGIERADPATGESSWKLDRQIDTEDEGPYAGVNGDETALFVRDDDGWASVDLASGAVGEAAPGAVAWMVRFRELEVDLGGETSSYLHSLDAVPFDPVRNSEVKSPTVSGKDVPAAVGATAAGMRLFLDGAGHVHGVPA